MCDERSCKGSMGSEVYLFLEALGVWVCCTLIMPKDELVADQSKVSKVFLNQKCFRHVTEETTCVTGLIRNTSHVKRNSMAKKHYYYYFLSFLLFLISFL